MEYLFMAAIIMVVVLIVAYFVPIKKSTPTDRTENAPYKIEPPVLDITKENPVLKFPTKKRTPKKPGSTKAAKKRSPKPKKLQK